MRELHSFCPNAILKSRSAMKSDTTVTSHAQLDRYKWWFRFGSAIIHSEANMPSSSECASHAFVFGSSILMLISHLSRAITRGNFPIEFISVAYRARWGQWGLVEVKKGQMNRKCTARHRTKRINLYTKLGKVEWGKKQVEEEDRECRLDVQVTTKATEMSFFAVSRIILCILSPDFYVFFFQHRWLHYDFSLHICRIVVIDCVHVSAGSAGFVIFRWLMSFW